MITTVSCSLEHTANKLLRESHDEPVVDLKMEMIWRVWDIYRQQDLLLKDENTEDYCCTMNYMNVIDFLRHQIVFSEQWVNLAHKINKNKNFRIWELEELKQFAIEDLRLQELDELEQDKIDFNQH